MAENQVFSQVATVVIGRNEGQRLIDCLQSLLAHTSNIVYVDSDSSDGSVEEAKKLGCEVVLMDMTQPFTAARARNAGFREALNKFSHLNYIQFVDGDCQVVNGWLPAAVAFLNENAEVAVVCGRRKEINPKNSIYNQLCDIEWNTPIGEAKACGGDALMRVDALRAVNGYKDDVIAGEEPELCVRLRKKGWKIWRLDAEMTLHDANILHFSQWWKRSVRAGHAYAEGASLHGAAPEYHWVAESRRTFIWGALIPLFILLLFLVKPVLGLISILIYPLQILRLTVKNSLPFPMALLHATFLTLGKLPEQIGQFKFFWNRVRNNQNKIIEYK